MVVLFSPLVPTLRRGNAVFDAPRRSAGGGLKIFRIFHLRLGEYNSLFIFPGGIIVPACRLVVKSPPSEVDLLVPTLRRGNAAFDALRR